MAWRGGKGTWQTINNLHEGSPGSLKSSSVPHGHAPWPDFAMPHRATNTKQTAMDMVNAGSNVNANTKPGLQIEKVSHPIDQHWQWKGQRHTEGWILGHVCRWKLSLQNIGPRGGHLRPPLPTNVALLTYFWLH